MKRFLISGVQCVAPHLRDELCLYFMAEVEQAVRT